MTESKRPIYSDLKKLDAHTVQPHEYKEAPELSDEELAKATVRRGRPPSSARKVPVKFRLDPDLVRALRASGPGWQSRVNTMLRGLVLAHKLKPRATYAVRTPAKKATVTKRVERVSIRGTHKTSVKRRQVHRAKA
jgi:uncharacterized protein (DUF4415 family)